MYAHVIWNIFLCVANAHVKFFKLLGPNFPMFSYPYQLKICINIKI